MAEQIWIRQGENVQGPFTRAKILEWMHQGRILTTMQLSADGRNWRMAGEAEDLLVDSPAAPVPVAPPAPAVPVAEVVSTGPSRPRHAAGRRRRRPGSRISRPPSNRTTLLVVAVVAVLAVAALVALLSSTGGTGAGSEEPNVAESLTAAQVVERCERSVALIRDQVASGTGFMVADGVLATNAHVVRRMILGDMDVLFPSVGRSRYTVDRVLHLDDKWDICLLSIRANHRPLPLLRDSGVKRGAELLIIGNPGVGDEITIENAVSRGLAGGFTTIRNRLFLQISAPINPGNSGGPVLDEAGRVIGMVTMKATEKESLAFAVPAREIANALAQAKQRTSAAKQKLDQKHLAGAIFLRLDLAGRAYLSLVAAYVQGIRAAIADGATTVDEALPYLPDISEAVDRVRATTGRDLDRYIGFIDSASWMDDETRESLLDFQQIVRMFESRAANRDVMSVISHVAEFDNLFGRFRALEEDLRLRFDLPEDELE